MELHADKDSTEVRLIFFHPDELRTRAFNAFVDKLLLEGKADEEAFAKLTPVQRHVYSVLNRAFARIERLPEEIKHTYERYIDSE